MLEYQLSEQDQPRALAAVASVAAVVVSAVARVCADIPVEVVLSRRQQSWFEEQAGWRIRLAAAVDTAHLRWE